MGLIEMNKKEKIENSEEYKEYQKDFHIPLIIGTYLVLDIILLFALCVCEIYFDVSNQIVLMISFILEFIGTFYVAFKGNIKSAIILYILLLASPAFIGLIAMGMYAIMKNAIPFTPTILYAFRTGYTLNWQMLNSLMRIIITFRLPALVSIILCSLYRLFTNKNN